jgi:integrase
LDCAGRIGDVFAFTWQSLTIKKISTGKARGTMYMPEQKTNTAGTGVLEDETVRRLLQIKPKLVKETERIFDHWDNVNTFNSWVNRAATRLGGIHFQSHNCRKTKLSSMLRNKKYDIAETMQYGRQKTLAAAQAYVAVDDLHVMQKMFSEAEAVENTP